MTRILALDTLTMDYFFEVPKNSDTPDSDPSKQFRDILLKTVFDSMKITNLWKDNDKATLDDDFGYTFVNRMVQNQALFNGLNLPGGSAANTLINMMNGVKHLGYDIELDFLTTVSDLPSGKRIKEALSSHGNIRILPELDPDQQEKVKSPSSYVFIEEENGKIEKKVAKGAGHGNKDFITARHVREAFANSKYDLVFIPASAVEKFSPSVAYAMVDEAVKQGSQIIFAYPTELTAENKKFAEYCLSKGVTVVLGNTDEICNFYNHPKTPEGKIDAMAEVRKAIEQHRELDPVAFISDGLHGSYAIKPDAEFIHGKVWEQNTKVKDKTGAGDSFNSGALAMWLLGFDNLKTLLVSLMAGARYSDSVVQQVGAQLPQAKAEAAIDDVLHEKDRWLDDNAKPSEPKLVKTSGDRSHALS